LTRSSVAGIAPGVAVTLGGIVPSVHMGYVAVLGRLKSS